MYPTLHAGNALMRERCHQAARHRRVESLATPTVAETRR